MHPSNIWKAAYQGGRTFVQEDWWSVNGLQSKNLLVLVSLLLVQTSKRKFKLQSSYYTA